MGQGAAISARTVILASLATNDQPDQAQLAAEAQSLGANLDHPPDCAMEIVGAFLQRLNILGVSSDVVSAWSDVPARLAYQLAVWGVASAVFLPPEERLAELDWTGIDLLNQCPMDDGVAVAIAVGAAAETGTVVLETSASAPMLPNFLALHHVVLVECRSIQRWLEDVPHSSRLPRQRTWVTGISGTTDIEGEYVRGAHGPRFLHVIVIKDSETNVAGGAGG